MKRQNNTGYPDEAYRQEFCTSSVELPVFAKLPARPQSAPKKAGGGGGGMGAVSNLFAFMSLGALIFLIAMLASNFKSPSEQMIRENNQLKTDLAKTSSDLSTLEAEKNAFCGE